MNEIERRKQLENKMDHILSSPSDHGDLKMIVRRPAIEEREILEEGEITFGEGLKGDTWNMRGSSKTNDGGPLLEAQITIINSRLIDAITESQKEWALAGDQLYVDFDLSENNIPSGTLLKIGESILEVSSIPHTGCGKFKKRFGSEVLKFINSKIGREKNLRGINAKVIKEGRLAVGDKVIKTIST